MFNNMYIILIQGSKPVKTPGLSLLTSSPNRINSKTILKTETVKMNINTAPIDHKITKPKNPKSWM